MFIEASALKIINDIVLHYKKLRKKITDLNLIFKFLNNRLKSAVRKERYLIVDNKRQY